MLKKIELTNFKSFRETTVDFGALTVLVGTNASGKGHPFRLPKPGNRLTTTSVQQDNAVNLDAFFVRYAHYKCASHGWR